MHLYHLSPHVFLELFAEDAILLIAERDLMVTVNLAAARLFEQARELIGDRPFSRSDCRDFLLEQYELDEVQAEHQTRSILGFSLRQKLIVRSRKAVVNPQVAGADFE